MKISINKFLLLSILSLYAQVCFASFTDSTYYQQVPDEQYTLLDFNSLSGPVIAHPVCMVSNTSAQCQECRTNIGNYTPACECTGATDNSQWCKCAKILAGETKMSTDDTASTISFKKAACAEILAKRDKRHNFNAIKQYETALKEASDDLNQVSAQQAEIERNFPAYKTKFASQCGGADKLNSFTDLLNCKKDRFAKLKDNFDSTQTRLNEARKKHASKTQERNNIYNSLTDSEETKAKGFLQGVFGQSSPNDVFKTLNRDDTAAALDDRVKYCQKKNLTVSGKRGGRVGGIAGGSTYQFEGIENPDGQSAGVDSRTGDDQTTFCPSELSEADKEKYACGLLPPGAMNGYGAETQSNADTRQGSNLTEEDFLNHVDQAMGSFADIEAAVQSCHGSGMSEGVMKFQSDILPWIQFVTSIIDMMADIETWKQAAGGKFVACAPAQEYSAVVMSASSIASVMADLFALAFYIKSFVALNNYIDEEFGAELRSSECGEDLGDKKAAHCFDQNVRKNIAFDVNNKYGKILGVLKTQTSDMIINTKATLASTAIGLVGDGLTAVLATIELARMATGCGTPGGSIPGVYQEKSIPFQPRDMFEELEMLKKQKEKLALRSKARSYFRSQMTLNSIMNSPVVNMAVELLFGATAEASAR